MSNCANCNEKFPGIMSLSGNQNSLVSIKLAQKIKFELPHTFQCGKSNQIDFIFIKKVILYFFFRDDDARLVMCNISRKKITALYFNLNCNYWSCEGGEVP